MPTVDLAHRQPAGVAAGGEPDQVLTVGVREDAGPPAAGRQRVRGPELDPAGEALVTSTGTTSG